MIGWIEKTYDYFLYVVSSLPQSVCVGYVDSTLPLVAMHHMILRVRRKFFEITTKPNSVADGLANVLSTEIIPLILPLPLYKK